MVPLSAEAPSGWVNIAMVGAWEGHSAGPFTFTAESFAQIMSNFARRATPVKFDYEHDSLDGNSGPKPASGYVLKLELRAEGRELWAFVEWTPRAAMMIKGGEYRYCSPVVDFEAIDRQSGKPCGAELCQVALTNDPFLDGQHPIQLSMKAAVVSLMTDEEKRREHEAAAKAAADAKAAALSAPPPFPPKEEEQVAASAPPPFPPKEDEVPPVAAAVPPPPAAAAPGEKTPEEMAAAALAGEPPNGPNDAPPAGPAVSAEESDASAFIGMMADAAGGDKARAIASMIEHADEIIKIIQADIGRDGTPAESNVMSNNTDDEEKQFLKLQVDAQAEQIAALSKQFTALQKSNDDKAKADIEREVDALNLPKDKRETAIWAFTKDPKRAREIYKAAKVPMGRLQSAMPVEAEQTPSTGAPNSSDPKVTVVDLSAFSRAEQATILALQGAGKTEQAAAAVVMSRRAMADGKGN